MADKKFNWDEFEDDKPGATAKASSTFNWDDHDDSPEQDISQLSSAGKGLQQGALFGFADEIGGLAGALGSMSGGDKRDFSELYKEARDVNRDEYKAAESANPKSYLLGQVGGGALVPLGAVNAAKGAGALASIGAGSATGAIQGGLTGAGMSEKEAVGDIASDALSGAKTGALVGGALSSAGVGLKSASKLFPKASLAFEEGLAGNGIIGREAADRANQGVIDTQGQAEGRLSEYIKKLSQDKDRILSEATGKGRTVDLAPVYNNAMADNLLSAPQSIAEEKAAERLMDELQNLAKKSQASGSDLMIAERQKQALQLLSKAGQGADAAAFPQSPITSKIYKNTARDAKQAIESAFENNGVNPIKDVNERLSTGYKAQENNLVPSIGEVGRAGKEFEPSVRAKLQDLQEVMGKLNPAEAGPTTESFKPIVPEIKRAGQVYDITKQVSGIKPNPSGIYKAIANAPEIGSNLAGLAANKGGNAVTAISKSLSKITPQEITDLVAKAQASGNGLLARTLGQLNSKDLVSKNATIYLISQDPKMRKDIEELSK